MRFVPAIARGRVTMHLLPRSRIRFGRGPLLHPVGLRQKIGHLKSLQPRPDIEIVLHRPVSYGFVESALRSFQRAGYGPRFGVVGLAR